MAEHTPNGLLDRPRADVLATPADASPVTDRIELRGITGFGHHGFFDFEKAQGQSFVVDLVCHVDLSVAERSDVLADTLDYGALAQGVVADIERDPLDLIEALAGRIAATVLADRRVRQVEVTVHKPQAPMPVPVTDTAVTLVRRQTDLTHPADPVAVRDDRPDPP